MAKWQQGDPNSAFRNAAECVRSCLSFNETSLFTVSAETLAGIALGSGEHARAARILGMVERTSLLVGAGRQPGLAGRAPRGHRGTAAADG
jgi:hypothetical protein